MIKNQIKCPKCHRVLLRLYSNNVKSITCVCGHTIEFVKRKDGYGTRYPKKEEEDK